MEDKELMSIQCTGCKRNCKLTLFRPRYSNTDFITSIQCEAINAKMAQFRSCPHLPQDNSLTNLTEKGHERAEAIANQTP